MELIVLVRKARFHTNLFMIVKVINLGCFEFLFLAVLTIMVNDVLVQ